MHATSTLTKLSSLPRQFVQLPMVPGAKFNAAFISPRLSWQHLALLPTSSPAFRCIFLSPHHHHDTQLSALPNWITRDTLSVINSFQHLETLRLPCRCRPVHRGSPARLPRRKYKSGQPPPLAMGPQTAKHRRSSRRYSKRAPSEGFIAAPKLRTWQLAPR